MQHTTKITLWAVLQDSGNDKLGLVLSETNCPTARTMDGVLRQLTLWTRSGGEIKRKTVKYKTRKVAPRARAPPVRAPLVSRPSVRAPGAASKASLRRMAKDDAAADKPAAPRAPRAPAAPKVKDAAAEIVTGKRAPQKTKKAAELTDTEEEELELPEEDPAGLTLLDEGDPEVRPSTRVSVGVPCWFGVASMILCGLLHGLMAEESPM